LRLGDVLHDDIRLAILLTGVVDLENVGVIQSSGRLCLVNEQLARDPGTLGIVVMGTYFDSDGTVDERIVGNVHIAHGAAARDIHDFVFCDFFRTSRIRFVDVHLQLPLTGSKSGITLRDGA
jgi:hypothetical protein